MQNQARVVIIGGGIVGCSVAYHLTKIGWTDVLLLERKELACGTTWAAAGLLTQLRQNQEMTNLAKYTVDLYKGLEAETVMVTGFRRNGAVPVCRTEDRRKELLRAAAMARAFGIEMNEISPKEAGELVPGMTTDDLVAAFYLPGDGVTNPIETTRALAKGAKMQKHCDRGAAFGDLDLDGDVDIVVCERSGPVRVLRNDRDGGNWLIVRLRDRMEGHDLFATGSRVAVKAGSLTQYRWIASGTSFLVANEMMAHFGLPEGVDEVTVEVKWPDGKVEVVEGVKARTDHTVVRE